MLSTLTAQVEIDQSVQLTGGAGQSTISGLVDAPVNGTDAVNKDYVDAAIAAGGGGGENSPTMMSAESAGTMTWWEAHTYCSNLTEGGYTDWYVGSVNELTEFFKNNGVIPNNTSTSYLWLGLDGSHYNAGNNGVPIVSFGSNNGALTSSAVNSGRPVRCVR